MKNILGTRYKRFMRQRRSRIDRDTSGVAGVREGRRSQNLKAMGEEGAMCSWYDGTETGDSRVG